jgi:hypothetical protein
MSTYKCFKIRESGNWEPVSVSEVRGIAAVGKIAKRRKVSGVGSTRKRKAVRGVGSKSKKKGWF